MQNGWWRNKEKKLNDIKLRRRETERDCREIQETEKKVWK